jgi:hypothetical protein
VPIPHDDGSDRDLAPPGGGVRQTESAPHPQVGDIGAGQAAPPSGRWGSQGAPPRPEGRV